MRQVDNQVLSVIDDHLRAEMDEHVALTFKRKLILESKCSHGAVSSQ